jgi:putative phosphoesterase
MRVGLITDTHIPDVARELPPQVFDAFQGVDLILHAGDIYSLAVLDELQRLAPVLAVLGDDDHFTLAHDERVKTKHVLELEGQRVWLVHEAPWFTRWPAQKEGYTPNVVVHGHSHEAEVRTVSGVLFVGSGSPTFLRYRRGPGSVAVLDIGPDGAEASIVDLGGISRPRSGSLTWG